RSVISWLSVSAIAIVTFWYLNGPAINDEIRIRFYWPSKFAQTRNLTWQSDSVCLHKIYITTQYKTIQYNTIQTKSATVQRSKKFKIYVQGGMAIYSSCEMLHNNSAKKKWRVQEVQG